MPTQARTANVSFLVKNSLRTEYKPLHFFRHFYIFFGSKALASCSRHCEFCLDFLIFFSQRNSRPLHVETEHFGQTQHSDKVFPAQYKFTVFEELRP